MPVMLEMQSEICLRSNFVISASMMEGLNHINQAGAERAQQALAGFLGQEAEVEIETITILPLTLLAQRLRATKAIYRGCHMRIFGDLQAELYCYLRVNDARSLAAVVLRHCHSRGRVGRALEESALAEMAGVLANGYWLALHGQISLNWRTTAPAAVTKLERIFALASRIGHYDYLVFLTELSIRTSGIRLYFCLIPGANCLNRLLQSLDAEHLHRLVKD